MDGGTDTFMRNPCPPALRGKNVAAGNQSCNKQITIMGAVCGRTGMVGKREKKRAKALIEPFHWYLSTCLCIFCFVQPTQKSYANQIAKKSCS